MSRQDEPVFVVKLAGVYRKEEIERAARKFKNDLPGRVVVIDSTVEDIYKLTEQDVTKLVRVLEGKVNE